MKADEIDNFRYHSDKMSLFISKISKFYDIKYFSNTRFYKDSITSLTTSPELINYSFNNPFYKIAGNILPEGIYKWEDYCLPEILSYYRNNLGLIPGYTILFYHDNYIDQFSFAGCNSGRDLNYLFQNKFHVINHFISWYKDKSQELIKTPQIFSPRKSEIQNDVLYNSDREELFLSSINNKKYFYNGEDNKSYLSKSERFILVLTAHGYVSKEISEIMSLSFESVNTYRKRILRKLNVRNITQAVHVAQVEGLIS